MRGRLAAFLALLVGLARAQLRLTDPSAGAVSAATLEFAPDVAVPADAALVLRLPGDFCDQLYVFEARPVAGMDGSLSAYAEFGDVFVTRAGDGSATAAGANVTIALNALSNPFATGGTNPSELEVYSAAAELLTTLEVPGPAVGDRAYTWAGGSGSVTAGGMWDVDTAPTAGAALLLAPAADATGPETWYVNGSLAFASLALQPGAVGGTLRVQPTADGGFAMGVGAPEVSCSLRLRPTISSVADVAALQWHTADALDVAVDDEDTELGELQLELVSDDWGVLAPGDAAFEAMGDGGDWRVWLTPSGAGVTHAAVRVFDGYKTASAEFEATVGAVGNLSLAFVDAAVDAASSVMVDTAYQLNLTAPASVGATVVRVSRETWGGDCYVDTAAGGAFDATAVDVTMAHGDVFADALWVQCRDVNLTGTWLTAAQLSGANELGAFRSAPAPVSVVDVPAAPETVAAAAGDTEVTVTWAEPDDGGAAITGYTVASSLGGSQDVGAGALSLTVTGLTNGVQVSFTVVAHSAVGQGDWSAATTPVIPQGSLTVVLGDFNVVVGDVVAFTVVASAAPVAGSLEVLLDDGGVATLLGTVEMSTAQTQAAGSFVLGERGSQLPVQLALGGDAELEFAVPAAVYLNAECGDLLDGSDCSECAAGAYRAEVGGACATCPDNAACAGGDEPPVPLAGYYSTSAGEIAECSPQSACLGGFGDGTCSAGYVSARCSECDLNYYRASGECIVCPNVSPFLIVVGILCVVAMMAMLAAAMLVVMDLVVRLPELALAFPVMTMTLDYLQVISLLSTSDIWPYSISVSLRWFTIFRFNIDVLSAECAGLDYRARWGLVQMSPVLMTMALALYLSFDRMQAAANRARDRAGQYMARTAAGSAAAGWSVPFCGRRSILRRLLRLMRLAMSARVQRILDRVARGFKNKDKIIGLWVEFMQLVYIGVTSKTLEVFDCVRQPDGTAVMEAMPSAYCVGPPFGDTPGSDVPEVNKTLHRQLLPFAIVSMCVYTVGVPVAAWFVLNRKIEIVPDDQLRLAAKNPGEQHSASFVAQFERFGRMYTRYRVRPRTERERRQVLGENDAATDGIEWPRYWSVVLMVKKCWLVILTAMFTANPGMQFSSMCFIIVLAWMFSVRTQPYVESRTLMMRERSHRTLAKHKARMAKLPDSEQARAEAERELAEAQAEAAEQDREYNSAVARLRLNKMESILHGCVFLVIVAALLFYSASWRSDWERALVTVIVLALLMVSGFFVAAILVSPMLVVWKASSSKRVSKVSAWVDRRLARFELSLAVTPVDSSSVGGAEAEAPVVEVPAVPIMAEAAATAAVTAAPAKKPKPLVPKPPREAVPQVPISAGASDAGEQEEEAEEKKDTDDLIDSLVAGSSARSTDQAVLREFLGADAPPMPGDEPEEEKPAA